MKTIFYPEAERGGADHGWLKARHSFSFAGWYHPERMHFGALRVLNDDWIAPATGFGMHPHDNMEIVTIPLSGAVRHRDNFGHEGIIKAGEVQVMSAGKGILHSEMNPLSDEPTTLLQIWVMPSNKDTEPWYQQSAYELKDNNWTTLVSGWDEDGALPFGQEARFVMGKFSKGSKSTFHVKKEDQGVYWFVLDGKVNLAGQILEHRDALGVSEANEMDIQFLEDTRILAIEVPMHW